MPGSVPPPSPVPGGPPADAGVVDVLDTPEAGGLAIRGGAVRAVGQVLVLALSLVSLPLLTRYLGVVEFGRYALVVSLVAMVATVTDSGLQALAVREYAASSRRARDELMADLLGLRLALTLLAVLAAVGYAVLAGFGGPLVLGTLLAGVGLAVTVAQSTLVVPLSVELRLGWVTAAEVLRQVTFVALIVGLVFAGAGIVAFLAVPIAGGGVALVTVVRVTRGRVPLRPRFDLGRWRALLRETLPLAAAGLINNVYFRIVLLIMGLIASGLQTGYFALSFRVVEVLTTVPFLLIGTLLPLLTRAARNDDIRLGFAMGRTWDVALICGAWFSLCTFLGAGVAIRFIASGQGAPAAAVLRIQALTLGVAFLTVAWGTALVALRWHKPLVLGNVLALALTLALTLVLVPPLGARGAAIATVVGELSLLLAYSTAVVRRRPALWPGLGVLPRVAVAAVAGLAVVLVPVPEAVRVALGTLIYFGVLVALRGLPLELTTALGLGRFRPLAARRPRRA